MRQGVVLAIRTKEVAAIGSGRENHTAGEEMIEGLFFYRIQGQGGHLSIIQAKKRSFLIDPHPA